MTMNHAKRKRRLIADKWNQLEAFDQAMRTLKDSQLKAVRERRIALWCITASAIITPSLFIFALFRG